MAAMASLTRADLQDELEKFARDALQNALSDLQLRIVADLRSQGGQNGSLAVPRSKVVFEEDRSSSKKAVKLEATATKLRQGFRSFTPAAHEGLKKSAAISNGTSNSTSNRVASPAHSTSKQVDSALSTSKSVDSDQNAPERPKVPLHTETTEISVLEEGAARSPTRRSEGSALPPEHTANTSPKHAYSSPQRGQLASMLLDDAEQDDETSLQLEQEVSNLLDPTKELQGRQDMNDVEYAAGKIVRSVQAFVETGIFNYGSCLFVLLNSLTIGAETDYIIRNLNPEAPPIFKVIDVLFCTVFTIELTLRFIAYGWSFWTMQGWAWNVFDCFVVTLQLSDLLLHAFVSSISDTRGSPNLSFLRLLRVLRLVRIIRLMRVLRLVDELRTIVASILGSMKSLIWTLVLLVLLMYSGGVCITQVVADHLVQLEYHDKDVSHVQTDDLRLYYSNLSRSILTLFEGITGGLNWDPLMMSLANDISVWAVPVFCIYVAFCLFAVMNSVTGVFCEKASAQARDDQELFLAQTCRKTFEKNIFANKKTTHKDQVITWNEFAGQLHSEEVKEFFKAIDVCITEAEALFSLLDSEGKGSIHLAQFMHGILKLRGPAKSLDLTLLMNETDQMFALLLQHMGEVEGKLDRIESCIQNSSPPAEAWQGHLAI